MAKQYNSRQYNTYYYGKRTNGRKAYSFVRKVRIVKMIANVLGLR